MILPARAVKAPGRSRTSFCPWLSGRIAVYPQTHRAGAWEESNLHSHPGEVVRCHYVTGAPHRSTPAARRRHRSLVAVIHRPRSVSVPSSVPSAPAAYLSWRRLLLGLPSAATRRRPFLRAWTAGAVHLAPQAKSRNHPGWSLGHDQHHPGGDRRPCTPESSRPRRRPCTPSRRPSSSALQGRMRRPSSPPARTCAAWSPTTGTSGSPTCNTATSTSSRSGMASRRGPSSMRIAPAARSTPARYPLPRSSVWLLRRSRASS